MNKGLAINPTVIGITGPFGSGKSTAASFFETKGFKKITLSSFLEEQLRLDNKEITRKNLQDLGNLWRDQEGSGVLAKKALEFIYQNNIEKAVIDGIRNLGEIDEFKQTSRFILLGVVADRDVRLERVKSMRNREGLTRELFDELDLRDLGITEDKETGLQVAKCLAISDYFINSNDEINYKQRLEEFLNKL